MELSEEIEATAAERGALASAAEALAATRMVRVMTYNILAGGWRTVDALAEVMLDARPDLIGMQEVAPGTLAKLADRLEMHAALSPSRYGAPVALLSRWPLLDVNRHPGAPLRNALLEAVVAPEGSAPLRVFVTHLSAYFSRWRGGEGERLRELAFVLEQMHPTAHEAQLLMGDFNSMAPGERLLASQLLLHTARNDERRAKGEDMSGHPSLPRLLPAPIRPLASVAAALMRVAPLAWLADQVAGAYVPRAVVGAALAAGYRDLYAEAHPDPRQRAMSYSSSIAAGRIDYIFASPALAAGLLTCEALGETPTRPVSRASDHLPLLATIAAPAAQG
ncbi:MAG: endonuclease/exonuclease/phosphatase family protein [Chloroflexota bacterium]|nr:endonuclease/exonuclease/phosphatase family protein [Chloroflexota bacterium]